MKKLSIQPLKQSARAVSSVITTILLTSTLLIILLIASFVSTNILAAQMESTEFEQAKTNMGLLDNIIQDVSLRQGAGGYVQFNQRTGGIGLATDEAGTITLSIQGNQPLNPETLLLRPSADGSSSDWNLYGAAPNKWSATNDGSDATGVQVVGSMSSVQTVKVQEPTQSGTINSITALVKAKTNATGGHEILYVNSFDGSQTDWIEAGASPYLNDQDSNYIYVQSSNKPVEGNFGYADHNQGSGQILSARVYFETKANGNDKFSVSLYDDAWQSIGIIDPCSGYNWKYIDVTSYLNSWSKVDNCQVKITYESGSNKREVYVRRSYLDIEYAGNPETAKVQLQTNGSNFEGNQDFIISRTGFIQYSEVFAVNPVTGKAWTWSDLNSLEVGCRATALETDEKIQVSELWVEVNYTQMPELTPIYSTTSLTSFVYRAGTQTSGTSKVLSGDNTINNKIDQPMGYLRVETGDGLKIKLDYNRVRTVFMGTIAAHNSAYDFYDITIFHLVKGDISSASDTVNVRVQNQDIRTTSFTYENGVTIVAQVDNGPTGTCVNSPAKTVVMVTEITIVVSIG